MREAQLGELQATPHSPLGEVRIILCVLYICLSPLWDYSYLGYTCNGDSTSLQITLSYIWFWADITLWKSDHYSQMLEASNSQCSIKPYYRYLLTTGFEKCCRTRVYTIQLGLSWDTLLQSTVRDASY